jgi:very-short-patch-repair endonuclease
MSAADVTIVQEAARSDNVITRKRLLALGLTERQIDRRVAAGMLVPIHRAVYLVGGGEPSFEQRVLAACRAGQGWASHRCGAALFRLRRIPPGSVEITVAGRRAPDLDGVLVHETGVLEPFEKTKIGRIPVTAPTRILLDLAGTLPPHIVEGALDDALVRHLTTLGSLERLLKRAGGSGRAGSMVLAELVLVRREGRERPTESELEDDLKGLIRRSGLPEPDRQHAVDLPGGGRVRFDCAYPALRLALEADGNEHHAGLLDRQRDEARDRHCAEAGWTVRRFSTNDIRRHPHRAAAVIARLLGVETTA